MVKLRCRTILLIAIGLSWFSGAMADLSDGLVAYYPFDGNANDESGNGNNGTVNGNIQFVTGKKGQAANFKGAVSENVLVKNFPVIRESLTISTFFKPSSFGYPVLNPIVTRGYSREEAYTLWVNSSTSVTLMLNWESSERIDCNTIIEPPLSTGEFYHIASVYDYENKAIKLYLNGDYLGGCEYSHPIYDQTEPLYIATSYPGGQDYLKGSIDELRIYNRALSESEIQQLYQMDNHPSDDCWATYENGNLHIPCIKVKGPFDGDLHYEGDMQYEPLSDPMSFQVTGVKPK